MPAYPTFGQWNNSAGSCFSPVAASISKAGPGGGPHWPAGNSTFSIGTDWKNRMAAARQPRFINLRPGCRPAVTGKRAVENYFHPRAVFEARGMEIQFSDEDDVADVAAAACYAEQGPAVTWESLPARARKRYRNHVKHGSIRGRTIR